MQLTFTAFETYLSTCRRDVAAARLFVLGHPAPDGDAVVSSLLEGWRRTLTGPPAVPVVQGKALPREVARLLGAPASLVLTAPEAAGSLAHPDSRFVLTDHHASPYLSRTVAVMDHHPLTPGCTLTEMEADVRPVGAATTLVAERLRREGFLPDAGVSRILLGGILLDTDGLSPYKAKPEDLAAAEWLSALCGEDFAALYAALQEELLSETDVEVLYRRDYRTYALPDGTPGVGFAILKVRPQAQPCPEAVRRLLQEEVTAGDFPLCVAKTMVFFPDGSREEQYLAAGVAADEALRVVEALAGPEACRPEADRVVLPAGCPHPGRKRLAPLLLEKLVAAKK